MLCIIIVSYFPSVYFASIELYSKQGLYLSFKKYSDPSLTNPVHVTLIIAVDF